MSDNKKLKIYLASGWFSDDTKEILANLESKLDSMDSVELYSPSRDGIMLPSSQKHDPVIREKVFNDNISHICDSDLVLANIYSRDPYNDPGTIYEIGYAMAHDVPVVGFTTSNENISDRFKGIIPGFEAIIYSYDSLEKIFNGFREPLPSPREKSLSKDKVLFVGAGDMDVDNKIISYIAESGANLRCVNEDHEDIYSRIDEIFRDVQYMVAVIDDRKTLVSWMIGQAYSRGIPVITYSDHDYEINVMLLVSVLTHIRGVEELQNFLQQVKRGGLESIPKFDSSQFKSC